MREGNTLDPGVTRLGYASTRDDPGAKLPAALQRDATTGHVQLLLLLDSDIAEPYRWFMDGVRFIDDPDASRFRYSVPDFLWFRDRHGTVSLIQCHMRSARDNSFVGTGTVEARYVALGEVDRQYPGAVRDVRATVSGLPQWLGLTPFSTRRETDEYGKVQAVTLDVRSPEPILIDDNDQRRVSFELHWAGGQSSQTEAGFKSRFMVESIGKQPRRWREAMEDVEAVRELLSFSQWRREDTEELEARFYPIPGDVKEALRTGYLKWNTVLPAAMTTAEPKGSQPKYLMLYRDLGPEGLRHWLVLRSTYGRAFGPLLASIDHAAGSPELRLSEISMGLEALAYLEGTLDRELTKTKMNNMRFSDRLQMLLGDVADAVPRDTSDWPEEIANAYAAIKHANRELPPLTEIVLAGDHAAIIARVWIALRLGIDARTIATRLEASNVLDASYELVDDPADLT